MTAPGFAPVTERSMPDGATAVVHGEQEASVNDLRQPVPPETFVTRYSRPLPSYAETFSGPGYESKPPPTSPLAVAALVCGILGVFTLLPALGAIVLGHLGMRQTSRNTHLGHGLAVGGMVLGYAVLTVVGLILLSVWIADQ